WDGTDYQFPVNEPISQTALHGFGQDKPMQAYDFKIGEHAASADCKYKDGGEEAYYPFPFTFSIHFKLTAGALDIEMRFRNDGDLDLPVGLGWHPYFTLASRIDEMSMQMPYTELVGVDDRMIPTGKKYPYDDFAAGKRIGATVLDNCFAIPASEGTFSILLEGPEGKMEYWQETGVGKCTFVQVFTPPDRQAIALEPMTCAPDAFNSGEGLARLRTGEILSARFGMRVL
ncbi:MAG: aldose 1-epimerase, partial [Haliscomenobacter sp.]